MRRFCAKAVVFERLSKFASECEFLAPIYLRAISVCRKAHRRDFVLRTIRNSHSVFPLAKQPTFKRFFVTHSAHISSCSPNSNANAERSTTTTNQVYLVHLASFVSVSSLALLLILARFAGLLIGLALQCQNQSLLFLQPAFLATCNNSKSSNNCNNYHANCSLLEEEEVYEATSQI